MTPPKQPEINIPPSMMKSNGMSCPIKDSNCGIEKFSNALVETIAAGFNEVNRLQDLRIKQDVQLGYVIKKQEAQDDINKELLKENKELIIRLGEKVDKDDLTNAMETVRSTFTQMEGRMKFYIKSALGIVTLIIMIVVPLGMWIINHLDK